MEKDDCEIEEMSEADCIKRQIRRRSSIYGSPLVPSNKSIRPLLLFIFLQYV